MYANVTLLSIHKIIDNELLESTVYIFSCNNYIDLMKNTTGYNLIFLGYVGRNIFQQVTVSLFWKGNARRLF